MSPGIDENTKIERVIEKLRVMSISKVNTDFKYRITEFKKKKKKKKKENVQVLSRENRNYPCPNNLGVNLLVE